MIFDSLGVLPHGGHFRFFLLRPSYLGFSDFPSRPCERKNEKTVKLSPKLVLRVCLFCFFDVLLEVESHLPEGRVRSLFGSSHSSDPSPRNTSPTKNAHSRSP